MYILQRIVLPYHKPRISCSISIVLLCAFICPGLQAQAIAQNEQEKEIYAQQLMVKGMTQGFLGYHDKAIPLYEEALNITPYSATLNSALAESYEHMGEFTSALFYARQALSLDSTQLHFHRHLVRLYIQSGDNAMAEKGLIALLAHFPQDAESQSDLVEIQVLNGNLEAALITNNRLIEQEGPHPDLLETQLDLLGTLGRWGAYESALINREALYPQSIPYKAARVEFYIEQNRTPEALELLQSVLDTSPGHPALTVLMASLDKGTASTLQINTEQLIDPSNPEVTLQNARSIYDDNPEDPTALDAVANMVRTVLELSPDNFDALMLLGNVLFTQQNYSEAAPNLKNAVNQNPRFVQLWIAASSSYLYIHNYKESALLAEDALLLFPGQPPLLRLAAIAHIKTYNNSRALERSNEYLAMAESSTESDQRRAELLAYAGLLSSRLEEYGRAAELFDQALNLQPDNPVVMSTIALGLAEQGIQLGKALDLAARSVEKSPDNPLFMAILGRVHYKGDDTTNAEKWLNLSVQADDTLPEAYEFIGDVLLDKGNARDALLSWNKALELNPDNPMLSEKIRAHAN